MGRTPAKRIKSASKTQRLPVASYYRKPSRLSKRDLPETIYNPPKSVHVPADQLIESSDLQVGNYYAPAPFGTVNLSGVFGKLENKEIIEMPGQHGGMESMVILKFQGYTPDTFYMYDKFVQFEPKMDGGKRTRKGRKQTRRHRK